MSLAAPSRINEVEQMPGLGPKSRAMLRSAGISSLAQLREIGSVAAYVLVKRAECKPSLNLLWGVEGAISGEHWRDVARNHRASLLLALDQHEKNA
jgi:DNA transformation protein